MENEKINAGPQERERHPEHSDGCETTAMDADNRFSSSQVQGGMPSIDEFLRSSTMSKETELLFARPLAAFREKVGVGPMHATFGILFVVVRRLQGNPLGRR